jgi:copper oxidase (laccase) domain-containing protein
VTTQDGEGLLREVLEGLIDPGARSRLRVRQIDAIPFLEARLPGPFRACFTTRLGGESSGAFASLNLDPRSADDPAVVVRNRDRVARMLGVQGEESCAGASARTGTAPGYRLVSPEQAHGVRVVGTAEYDCDQAGGPCDGLTLHPLIDQGLAALLLFADCVPVVLAGEVDMAVAHGGWRGILGGIVQEAGRAMIGPPATAVIGPSIGPCCFTVGEEVARAFETRFGPGVVAGAGDYVDPGGDVDPAAAGGRGEAIAPGRASRARRLDLWAATTRALGELGIQEGQVLNPRLCTACNTDFFYSYRKEGPITGRQGCVAWAVSP